MTSRTRDPDFDNRDPTTTTLIMDGYSDRRIDIDPVAIFLNMVENCQEATLQQLVPPDHHTDLYEKYKQAICKDFDLDPNKY